MTLLKDGLNSMLEKDYAFLFPTKVCGFKNPNSDELNHDICEYLLSQRESDPDRDKFSIKGGWHSAMNLADLEFDWSKKLRNLIIESSSLYFPCPIPEDSDIECWGVILEKGNVSTYHTHPGTDLSGVYYVKASEELLKTKSGSFVIPDTRAGACGTLHTEPSWCHSPSTGMGLVFPAWVPHFVEPHFLEESRISISWNILLPLEFKSGSLPNISLGH